MKVLIYIGHPAQYHFFKNIILSLESNGIKTKVLIKSKDILENLVSEDGLIVENILPEGRKDSKKSILIAMIKRDVRVYKIAKKFKPDLLVGSDTSVVHVARLINKPGITVGEDDYKVIRKLAWLLMPFSKHIISPITCDLGPFNRKKISYPGFMKLAYLHPDFFKPNDKGLDSFLTGKYCIIRLAKLVAHHDDAIQGLSESDVFGLIGLLKQKNIRVYIDAEYKLSEQLAKYQLQIPKNRMHDLLYYSELLISDSQSMSVEAAMLGIPSIRYNDFVGKIGVLNELEDTYNLTFGIKPHNPDVLFKKVKELIETENLKQVFQEKRHTMLSEKINVTSFIVWFLINYPNSIKTLKSSPDFTNIFKQKNSI